ncbi:hypothetical protein ACFTAO_49220 [Paenibacillus rhizoplanae]
MRIRLLRSIWSIFFEYKYYNLITILGVILSFLFFIVLVLFFINKKTSYIGVLEKEIKNSGGRESGLSDYPEGEG